eukprot:4245650-Alexandrium_andersonii.AAC.1
MAAVHARTLEEGTCAIPGPVRRLWQTRKELRWRWPSFDFVITERGIVVDFLRDSRRWIGHLLREAQRRRLLRRVWLGTMQAMWRSILGAWMFTTLAGSCARGARVRPVSAIMASSQTLWQ